MGLSRPQYSTVAIPAPPKDLQPTDRNVGVCCRKPVGFGNGTRAASIPSRHDRGTGNRSEDQQRVCAANPYG